MCVRVRVSVCAYACECVRMCVCVGLSRYARKCNRVRVSDHVRALSTGCVCVYERACICVVMYCL